jgi:hypothetical protein
MLIRSQLILVLDEIISIIESKGAEAKKGFVIQANQELEEITFFGFSNTLRSFSSKHPLALVAYTIKTKAGEEIKIEHYDLGLIKMYRRETMESIKNSREEAVEKGLKFLEQQIKKAEKVRGTESKPEIFISKTRGVYRDIGASYRARGERKVIILDLIKKPRHKDYFEKTYSNITQLTKSLQEINRIFKKKLQLSEDAGNLILSAQTGELYLNHEYYSIKIV